MHLDRKQIDEFQALETQLWVAEMRGDREWMDTILSPTFTEHGRSGRIYDRTQVRDAEMPEHIPIELPFANFTARQIDTATVLVTYTSIVEDSTREPTRCIAARLLIG